MTEDCDCCYCQHWDMQEKEGVNNLHCQKCIDLEDAVEAEGHGLLEGLWKWAKS